MSLPTERWRPLIRAAADLCQLPDWKIGPDFWLTRTVWLEGLVLHESSGNPRAYHPDVPNPRGDHELDASYGLMQVEGRTALLYLKRYGLLPSVRAANDELVADFSFLYKPIQNVALGCALLTEGLQRYGGHIDEALADYNGGPRGAEIVDGRLRDYVYVDAVAASSKLVRENLGG